MKTEKEILFEQIRNNEVVLWLGAGFSIPAGYLSGNDLKAELYKNFQPKDQKDINISEPLDIIASEYNAYYKRTGLINALQKIFDSITKKESKAHQLLAQFTFFNTIITTNYDSLIEDYIGSRIKVYYDDNDLPIDSNKAALLKIHGDFSHTNSFIITREDYAKIMDEFPKTLLYNSIIERLTNQNVLFIGYSFEDINTLSNWYKINSILGTHRKKCYIVSPSMNTSKIKRLEQQGIIYINSDGENFMNELEKNILDNAWKDYQNDPTNKAILSYFHNKNMGIKSDISPNGAKISNVYPLSGNMKQKIELTIDENQYFKLLEAKSSLEKVEIPMDACIKLEYRIEGILSSLITKGNVKTFILKPAPIIDTKINIAFTNNDFEFTNIPIKTYHNNNKARLELDLGFISLIINIFSIPNSDSTNTTVSINRKQQKFYQTARELEIYQLLYYLGNQEEFIITSEDSTLNFTYKIPLFPKELWEHIKNFKTFFYKLRAIEKKFHVSFENYEQILEDDIKMINELYNYTPTCLGSFKDHIYLSMYITEEHVDIIDSIKLNNRLTIQYPSKAIIQLLNKQLPIGNKGIGIINPDIIEKTQHGEDIRITIKVKKENVRIF